MQSQVLFADTPTPTPSPVSEAAGALKTFFTLPSLVGEGPGMGGNGLCISPVLTGGSLDVGHPLIYNVPGDEEI
jgi:hypothetical protein